MAERLARASHDEVPQEQFLGLVAEIQDATRNECASLVPPGFDHNCYDDEIEFGPVFTNDGPTKSDSCLHSCSYFNPPPHGTCPDNPNPFECNEQRGDEAGETGMTETAGSTGTESDSTDSTAGFSEREVQW